MRRRNIKVFGFIGFVFIIGFVFYYCNTGPNCEYTRGYEQSIGSHAGYDEETERRQREFDQTARQISETTESIQRDNNNNKCRISDRVNMLFSELGEE